MDRRRSVARLTAVSLVLAGLFCVEPRAEQGRPSVEDLVDRYLTGDRVAALADFAALPSFGRARFELERRAERWATEDARWGSQPRIAVATFLLEVAAARLETDWRGVRPLVEVGCRLVARVDGREELTRLWHLASLALVQGAADAAFLLDRPGGQAVAAYDHLEHSRSRFPDEPRFRLAAAVASEMGRTDTAPPRDMPWRSDDELRTMRVGGAMELNLRRERRRALAELLPLAREPAIAAEVHLRAGYLAFQLHQHEAAHEHLRRASTGAPDAFVGYVAHLVTGMLHARVGDQGAAERSWRRALEVVPHAQTATQLLAAQLFLTGRGDDAHALVDGLSARRSPVADPWRLFGYGDFHRLRGLLDQLGRGLAR